MHTTTNLTQAQVTANAWLAAQAPATETKPWQVVVGFLAVAAAVWLACLLPWASIGLMATIAVVGLCAAILGLGPVVLLLGFILYFVIRIANRK